MNYKKILVLVVVAFIILVTGASSVSAQVIYAEPSAPVNSIYIDSNIDTGGNVGFGINPDPLYKLDINGAIRLNPSAQPTANNGVIYYDSGSNLFRCRENGSWKNCIGAGGGGIGGGGTATQVAFFTTAANIGSDSSLYWDNTNKRLGIGTITPGMRLDVASRMRVRGTGVASETGGVWFADSDGTNRSFVGLMTDGASPIVGFWNGGTWNFVLNSSGNIGVGTTAISANTRMEVNGNITLSGSRAYTMTNVKTPIANSDTVPKDYVDAQVAGAGGGVYTAYGVVNCAAGYSVAYTGNAAIAGAESDNVVTLGLGDTFCRAGACGADTVNNFLDFLWTQQSNAGGTPMGTRSCIPCAVCVK